MRRLNPEVKVEPWMRTIARTRPVPLYEVWRHGHRLAERLHARTGQRFSEDEVARLVDGCAALAATMNLHFGGVVGRLGGEVPLSLARWWPKVG